MPQTIKQRRELRPRKRRRPYRGRPVGECHSAIRNLSVSTSDANFALANSFSLPAASIEIGVTSYYGKRPALFQ
jgi:hypothetical protein